MGGALVEIGLIEPQSTDRSARESRRGNPQRDLEEFAVFTKFYKHWIHGEMVPDYWFGTMEFYDFPFSWECHNPTWGVESTNQIHPPDSSHCDSKTVEESHGFPPWISPLEMIKWSRCRWNWPAGFQAGLNDEFREDYILYVKLVSKYCKNM